MNKILLLIIVIAVAVGVGGYLLRQDQDLSKVTSSISDTSDWKEYTDSRYPFSFKYPSELSVMTRQAPQQWQIDLVKEDINLGDGFDGSEYIASIWVEEWDTSIEEMLVIDKFNSHMIQEKTVETTFKGDRAVRIAFCEPGLSDGLCELPKTDKEVLEQGKRILIEHEGVIYTVTLPWHSNNVELFNGLLSTLTFE